MSFLHAILQLLPALCVALLLAAGDARGQTQAAPSTVSAAELEKLVGMLENDAERRRFVDQLKGLIEAERRVAPAEPVISDRVAARFLGSLSEQVAEFGAGILGAAAFVADAPNLFRWVTQQVESEWSRQRLTEILGKLALVLLGGWIAEWLVIWALARARRRIETHEIGEGWARAPYIVLYAVIALVPIVVFALAAFAILGAVSPTRTAALVATALDQRRSDRARDRPCRRDNSGAADQAPAPRPADRRQPTISICGRAA